jgi:hypothetical protein
MAVAVDEIHAAVAARELLQRRAARRTLLPFVEYTTPKWTAGRPHRVMCEQLDRVERGEIDRLMLLLPPQHGKSTVASKRYPAFALGRQPTHDIISASATHDLAEDFGREVRNCISGQECGNVFRDLMLAEDSQAKGRWQTKQGGSYYAVGIGGALFGRGATRAIIDDPFATWEDAQNKLARQRVWDWYTGTLYNRVRPGGAIVLIQHRMHQDDLAGRLIAQMQAGADKWEVVELPALGSYGALWPERYDVPALERIKRNTPEFKWSSLYQQKPLSEEGGIIKRAKWRLWPAREKLPRFLFVIMSLDTAYTEETYDRRAAEADFTACSVWGVFEHEKVRNAMLLDCWEERLGFPELIERVRRERDASYGDADEPLLRPLIDVAHRASHQGRKVDLLVIEEKGSGISLRQALAKEGILTRPYNPGRADKLARLHLVSPMFTHGRVWAVESDKMPGRPRTWADPLITQVCSFAGEGSIPFDDLMDSAVQALRVIMDEFLGPLTFKPAPHDKGYVPPKVNPYAQ